MLAPAGSLIPIVLHGFPLVAAAPGVAVRVPSAASGPEQGERLLGLLVFQVVHMLHLPVRRTTKML